MRFFDGDFLKNIIVAGLAAFAGWFLNSVFGKKVKLNHFILAPSTFPFALDGGTIYINTHSLIVRNNGSLPAVNLRVGHRRMPPNYTIFPARDSRVIELERGETEILIERLLPKEQITISYLYFPPLVVGEVHSYVKSNECFSKPKDMAPAPVISKPLTVFLWYLVICGAASTVYLFYLLGCKILS